MTTVADVARTLATITNHLEHQRRMIAKLDAKLDRLLAATDTATAPEGVRTLSDGRVFLPGTGTLGPRTLGPEAMAALLALDDKNPA